MRSIKFFIFTLCVVGVSSAQAFQWRGRPMSKNIADQRDLSRQTMLRDMYEFNVKKNFLTSQRAQLAIANCFGSMPKLTDALNVNINHNASEMIDFVSSFGSSGTTCSATKDRMSWDDGAPLIADFKIYLKIFRQLQYVNFATSSQCPIKELLWIRARFMMVAEMADQMNAYYATEFRVKQSVCARAGKEDLVEAPSNDLSLSEK
jgi:hypothetical protein